MKSQNPYQILPHYCLRTPIFPFTLYQELTKHLSISNTAFDNILENQTFIKAISLASPDLLRLCKKWKNSKSSLDTKKTEKLKFTILKYFTRSTCRPTPFGLFAGCSIGSFSSETSISLAPIQNHILFTRLDMSFLSKVIDNLLNFEEVKEKVLFYPNSSLYKVGNQYRYTSYIYEKDKRIYNLDGALYSQHLEQILKESKTGKKIRELSSLPLFKGIDKQETKDFLKEIINKQILVSELQLCITSSNNLLDIIKRLKSLHIANTILSPLEELHSLLINLDTKKTSCYTDAYRIIKEKFSNLDFSSKKLIQVDLHLTSKENFLSSSHKKALKNSMLILNKLAKPRHNKRLDNFKKEFIKRYDTNERPLLEILDTEIGIGYSEKFIENSSVLEDIVIPQKRHLSKKINWHETDNILLEKTINCIQKSEYCVGLNENDFKSFDHQWDDLPDTISALTEVIKLNDEEKLVINAFGGISAANILTRFSHGDHSILSHVQNIAKIEKEISRNKIIAEVIHLPQSREANILRRPSLRDYEISFLGKTSKSIEHQIPLNDIFVSVHKGNIVLRSKKFNKEILPRLTSAHNYLYGLPIYLFLCDLQNQNKRYSLNFKWNEIFNKFSFLPRIEYCSVILSKAIWNIKTKEIDFLFHLSDDELLTEVEYWREEMKIPELVELVEGDNLLLINMTNRTCVKMLLDTIKNRNKFMLQEFLFDKEGIVTKDDEYFCNQFVISLYNQQKLNTNKS